MSNQTMRVIPQNSSRGLKVGALPEPFYTQSFTFTTAWGAQPGFAELTYVAASEATVRVPRGAELTITGAGHTFTGVCVSDRSEEGATDGRRRTLRFEDFRFYLAKDFVLAAYNLVDVRLVDGVLRRRYAHVLPQHFATGQKTFTNAPLTAAEVVESLFGFTRKNFRTGYTVETQWRLILHRDMHNRAVLDLDFTSPRNLGAAVTEICDKLGLTFGIVEGTSPTTLTFVRKGEGMLPTWLHPDNVTRAFPYGSTQRNRGAALSGAATRVRIVGDRQRYQVMNVPLEPDWAKPWERFLTIDDFAADLFLRSSDETGVRLSQPRAGDPESFWGRFRAAELARTITVGQYADLRRRVALPGDVAGEDYSDVRKFAGRSRLDMPAALYLSTLLFRAFRPVLPLTFPNASGASVPLDSMELEARLLAPVTHDPVTGVLRLDGGPAYDGNGYAIAQGHRIGADGFVTVRPADFDFAEWSRVESLWQYIPFRPDDTGEGIPFLLFDEPVVRTQNLVEVVNGYATLRADGALVVPPVRAALVFAAERFNWVQGSGGYDDAVQVANLNGEYVTEANGGGAVVELPFADGQKAADKARTIATGLLARPWGYEEGGFDYAGTLPARLNAMWDRVQLSVGPQGVHEQVDFTKERGLDVFETTANLDRRRRFETLLPGQEELRQQARENRALAAQFRSDAGLRRTLAAALRGTDEPPVFLTGLPAGTVTTVPVGTPLWSAADAPRQGAAFAPATTDVVFAGVTARHNQLPAKGLTVNRTGEALVRVQGPVAANDVVGRASGTAAGTHLVKDGSVPVGRVRAPIAAAEVALVPVMLGAGGGGAATVTHPFQVAVSSAGAAGGEGGSETVGPLVIVSHGADSRIPRVTVGPGELALGLDYVERPTIHGLGNTFPLRFGDLIWLELWLDVTVGGDTRPPIAVGVAHGPNWNGSPKAVEVVTAATKPTDTVVDALFAQQWAVGLTVANTLRTAVKANLGTFPTAAGVRRQVRAFVLVGYTTDDPTAVGLSLSGIETNEAGEPVLDGEGSATPKTYTFVQCLKTHLLLAAFCDNGVPVRFPIAFQAGLPLPA
jgi:hypothetical protein